MQVGKKVSSVLVVMCVISQLSLHAFSQEQRKLQGRPQAVLNPEVMLERIEVPKAGFVLPEGLRFEPTGPGVGTIYMANNGGKVTLTCSCKKLKAGKGSCYVTMSKNRVQCTAKDGCQRCEGFMETGLGSAIGTILKKAVKATTGQTATTGEALTAATRATRTPVPTAPVTLKKTKRIPLGTKLKLPSGFTFVPKGATGGVIYLDNAPTSVQFDCECDRRIVSGKKGSCSTVFTSEFNELYCAASTNCKSCSAVIIWDDVDEAKASLLIRSVVPPAPATRR